MEKILNLPVLASEHGHDVDKLIIYVHWLMIGLFVGWLAYFIYALVRFRKSKNPKADHVGVRGPASSWLEGIIALIEAVLLIGFAIPLWAKRVDDFPPEKDATVVRVVAEQFGWNFIYSGADQTFGKQEFGLISQENKLGVDKNDPKGKDDIYTLNEMHVPIDKPVVVHITSKDVIHSFKIIAMRVTQDAIPGIRIATWFKPTREGRYQINCAQLCGNGHFSMTLGFVTVESREKYDAWFAEKSKTAGGGASFE